MEEFFLNKTYGLEKKTVKHIFLNDGKKLSETQYFKDIEYLNVSNSKSEGLNGDLSKTIGGTGDRTTFANSLSSGASCGCGVNVSASSTVTSRMFMDLNGDGLTDIVIKKDGRFFVRYNCGNSFLDE